MTASGITGRLLRIGGMSILVVGTLAAAVIAAVEGFRHIPYITVPLLIGLLVWGLFRTYDRLLRQAERAYLETRRNRHPGATQTADRPTDQAKHDAKRTSRTTH